MIFVELCSGIGGMRLGLERFGWKCALSVDIDEAAVAIQRSAIGETTQLDVRELALNSLPEHDMLVAGFPCQPFSSSGHRTGFHHEDGTVFGSIASIITKRLPEVVLLENVQGILSNQRGHTMACVLSTLTRVGYAVSWATINAAWLGALQNRPRVFFLAVRDQAAPSQDLLGDVDDLGLLSRNSFLDELKSWVTLRPNSSRVGSLTDLEQRLRPEIGKSAERGKLSFSGLGVAVGDSYVTTERDELPLRLEDDLGDACAPEFWKRDAIRSVRYWGHSGKTMTYLRQDKLAHCIGTTIGASPMFGVAERHIRTRADEQALLQYANWNRTEGENRVFRLTPARGLKLFGRMTKKLENALMTSAIPQTKLYELIGNMVVPEVGQLCGRLAAGWTGQSAKPRKRLRQLARA